MNTVSFVIGSWGSYNECNERALGSKWLDFDEYDDWDAIVEELKCEGFELDGIDEELFVQDIEGIPTDSKDWDNTHPKDIFELIKKSGVLDDDYKYDLMEAYCEVRSFDEWARLVDDYEDNWDRDIVFYRNMTMQIVSNGRLKCVSTKSFAKPSLYGLIRRLKRGLYRALRNVIS